MCSKKELIKISYHKNMGRESFEEHYKTKVIQISKQEFEEMDEEYQ